MLFKNQRAAALVIAMLWTFLLIVVAVGINVVGIRTLGNVTRWRLWLTAHGVWFLFWRICLYGVTAYGWWWMRERVRRREPTNEALSRLRHVEVAAVLSILAVETVTFLHTR